MRNGEIIGKNSSEKEKRAIKENTLATEDIEQNNPHSDLLTLFNPPTELPIKCFLDGERSFVEDRRFVGKRAAEIVEKKYGGYNKVSNEQLSLANKQAWEERISFCKGFQQKKNLEMENSQQNKSRN